jgi:hypothetical protein
MFMKPNHLHGTDGVVSRQQHPPLGYFGVIPDQLERVFERY